MSNNDLEFSLGIDTRKANEDVDKFVADAQKRFDKLTVNPTVSRSSRPANGLTNDLAEQQMQQEKLVQLREKALQKIDQLESQFGVRLTTERQQIENRLNQLVSNGTNVRISQAEREVNAIIQQSRRAAKAQQAAIGGAAGSGKSMQMVFQTQQMVEDFSFAGMRGASNNIAAMAASLGGPAGLAALMGITAIQAVSLADSFQRVDQDTERFAASAERLKNELMSLTDIRPIDKFDVSRPIEESERLSKSLSRAAESHRTLLETIGNRESISGLLTSFKEQNDVVKSQNDFGGWGPEAVQQSRQRIEEIKQQLQSIAPSFDWDKLLSQKSYEQIDKIIDDIRDKTTEGIDQINRSSSAVRSLTEQWQKAAIAAGKLTAAQKSIRDQFGLADGETFKAIGASENSPERAQLKQMERDLKYWEEQANKSLKAGDTLSFGESAAMANGLVESMQALKDAIDAVKDAEKEQLDTMRDKLREQKELNREKETQLNHERQILKEIEREQQTQRVSNASAGTDTRQGMTNNAISKMKERDEAIVGMSPNSDWQKIMKAQLDQYYNNVQTASDRFYAREKNNQLMANAQAANDGGDMKESRKYLEELKQHQQQQAMNAKTPQEANFWYQKSLQTQKQIEESFAKQKEQQQAKMEQIKNEIQSVDDLEKKVESLSDELRNVPKLDLQNPAVMQYLDQVDQKLSDMVKKMQQLSGAGGGMGGGGGMFGGGSSPFDSTGGGPPGGLGDFGAGFGGGQIPGGAGVNSPDVWYGGGSGTNGVWAGNGWERYPDAVGTSPVGGWGAMTSTTAASQSLGRMMNDLPQVLAGSNYTSQINNRNVSIGNMPVSINGQFDVNQLAERARYESSNNLLRRGA